MDNWLLWIVLAFLAVMVIIGLKNGFVKMLFSIVSLIATIILTIIIGPYVATYLKESTPVYETVQQKTCIFIENALIKMEEEAGESKKIEDLPLPNVIKEKLLENNNEETYNLFGAESLGEYISEYVSGIAVNAIAFCATFIVILIAIKLIVYFLDLISKLPLLNGLNRTLGAALGLLEGLIVLWILCLVVTAGAGNEWGQHLLAMINESEFLSFVYNNNYLMRFATDVLKLVLMI